MSTNRQKASFVLLEFFSWAIVLNLAMPRVNTQVFSFPQFASTDHLITKDFWTPKTNSGPRSLEAIN